MCDYKSSSMNILYYSIGIGLQQMQELPRFFLFIRYLFNRIHQN